VASPRRCLSRCCPVLAPGTAACPRRACGAAPPGAQPTLLPPSSQAARAFAGTGRAYSVKPAEHRRTQHRPVSASSADAGPRNQARFTLAPQRSAAVQYVLVRCGTRACGGVPGLTRCRALAPARSPAAPRRQCARSRFYVSSGCLRARGAACVQHRQRAVRGCMAMRSLHHLDLWCGDGGAAG